jgi:hypothetical protein
MAYYSQLKAKTQLNSKLLQALNHALQLEAAKAAAEPPIRL